jgi:hypothetical protein
MGYILKHADTYRCNSRFLLCSALNSADSYMSLSLPYIVIYLISLYTFPSLNFVCLALICHLNLILNKHFSL